MYLPGYTGHVPYKNDLFGITAGDANKVLVKKDGANDFFQKGNITANYNTSGGVNKRNASADPA